LNPIVVKIGGALMESAEALKGVTRALADAWSGGLPLVLVHGGGKDINRNLGWLGEEPRFKDGLRVTSEPALEIVEMTLSGSVNKRLVTWLQNAGARACGLSGVDGQTFLCRPLDPDLGRVGAVSQVRPALVEALLRARFLPVISPISADTAGAHYNVNADDAAAALAVALKAERLLFVSDVPGVLDAGTRIIPRLGRAAVEALIAAGGASGGMLPKLRSCVKAVEAGVGEVHICGFDGEKSLRARLAGGADGGTVIALADAGIPRFAPPPVRSTWPDPIPRARPRGPWKRRYPRRCAPGDRFRALPPSPSGPPPGNAREGAHAVPGGCRPASRRSSGCSRWP